MSEDAKPKLTDKQRAFIEEYLQCWNAAEAARRAGYSVRTAREIGKENLSKPYIRTEISRRAAEIAMSADEVLLRLASFGRGSFAPFIYPEEQASEEESDSTDEGVTLRLNTPQARRNVHLIRKIKVKKKVFIKEDGAIEEIETDVQIHDAPSALEKLGRAHGLFGDDSKILQALEAEREEVFAKLRKHLDAGDYQKAIEALSKPE